MSKVIGFLVVAGGAFFGWRFLSRLSDIDFLARTIWGEARGETREGRIAVANVVMNRVADRRWPNTVKAVVLQPFQFSAWNSNDPNRSQMLAVTADDPTFAESLEIAQAAVDGELEDVTNGADH